MSYGLIARCARSGRLGYAVASHSLNIGHACHGSVRSKTGLALTMGYQKPTNNPLAVRLLAMGFSPGNVLRSLQVDDEYARFRQIMILDRHGSPAAFTGESSRPWSGHRAEQNIVAFGDDIRDESVLDRIVRNFHDTADLALEDRLLAALESAHGDAASADRPRSAAIAVHGIQDYSDWDLRVDMHDDAVRELRRVTEEFKLMAAYYIARAKDPKNAKTQMEFVDMLKKDRPEIMP